jgi:hypothetical protein
LLLGLVVIVVAGWWLWPTIDGRGDDIDVLVVGDGVLATARRSIELRVREAGLSVEWHATQQWCDDVGALAEVVDTVDPGRIVVPLTETRACLDSAAVAIRDTDRLVVVVSDGGHAMAAVAASGYDVVDATRLIGAGGGPVTMPCEWWEQPCPPQGVAVRAADGTLTEAGGERLARVVATAL